MDNLRKLFGMLSRQQQKTALILLVLMVVGMGMEMIGIGLVIPAIALLTQPDIGSTYHHLQPILAALGQPTKIQLVSSGVLALVLFYITKSVYLVILASKQNKFIFHVQADLSERLFAGYLRQPWTFHLEKNSAQLIRNTIGETDLLTYQGLLPGMLFVTESLVLFGLAILLLVVEPLGSIVVLCIIGVVAFAFRHITRRYLLDWGRSFKYHEAQRLQHLQQGLGGAKDIKLLGRENELISRYRIHNQGSASATQNQTTLQQLPRVWLELLAVIGLAVLVNTMILQGKQMEVFLPTLAIFAATAFRLIPSINRILGALHNMRFVEPVIDNLYAELMLCHSFETNNQSIPIPYIENIKLDGISFTYPGANAVVLNNVNLTIPRGSAIGFIGESGSGKSTLVDLILGLLKQDSGRILVDDMDIQDNLRGWQNQIGYVPQNIYLTDDSLCRNIAFGIPEDRIDKGAVQRAIRAAHLDEFVRDLPNGLDTVVGERGVRISGGQRQRIGIARALYHDPPFLVLDEATSSLDTDTEQGVMRSVNALQGLKTVIIVAHRLSTVGNCSRVYRLEKGVLREALL